MSTSGKMDGDGLIEIPPVRTNADCLVEIPPDTQLYDETGGNKPGSKNNLRITPVIPKTVQEESEQRESISKGETDRFARWILVGCLSFIALSHAAQLVAEWIGITLGSTRLETTLGSIGYIATSIMGYLFGTTHSSKSK